MGSTGWLARVVTDPLTALPHPPLVGSATKALESAVATVPFTVGFPPESQMKIGSLEKMLPVRLSPPTKSTGTQLFPRASGFGTQYHVQLGEPLSSVGASWS